MKLLCLYPAGAMCDNIVYLIIRWFQLLGDNPLQLHIESKVSDNFSPIIFWTAFKMEGTHPAETFRYFNSVLIMDYTLPWLTLMFALNWSTVMCRSPLMVSWASLIFLKCYAGFWPRQNSHANSSVFDNISSTICESNLCKIFNLV